MNLSLFIGIDVSKLTFDARVHTSKQKKGSAITVLQKEVAFPLNTGRLVVRHKLRTNRFRLLTF